MSLVRSALVALALGLALGAPASGRAATVMLDIGVMQNARKVTIEGIGTVNAAPMQFKTNYDGKPVDVLAWCVDVYHSISVKDYAPDLEYVDTNVLTTDFGGHALDSGDVYRVGLLANYGQYLFDDLPVSPGAFTEVAPKRSSFPAGTAGTAAYNSSLQAFNARKAAHTAAVAAYNTAVSNRNMRLAAVQSAIWQVVSNRDVRSYAADATFDLLVDGLSGAHLTDYFVSAYDTRYAGITLITPVQKFGGKNGKTPLALTQSFVFATGAIPEPTTWALMILGFGATGVVLRRRRLVAA